MLQYSTIKIWVKESYKNVLVLFNKGQRDMHFVFIHDISFDANRNSSTEIFEHTIYVSVQRGNYICSV